MTKGLPMESTPAEKAKLVADFLQEGSSACTAASTKWKRERRCMKMVNFRLRKKQRDKDLRREWRRLEREMKQLGEDLRRTEAFDLETRAITNHTKKEAIRLLTVVKEALVKQNAALQDNLQRHHLLDDVMINGTKILTEDDDNVQRRNDSKDGWRVHFPFGEPSFHYHPITQDQFQAAIDSCYVGLLEQPLQVTGQCFNWNVQHATLASFTEDQSFSAYARFSRRLQCSLDAAVKTIENDIDCVAWPVIVTPTNRLGWGGKQVVTFAATIFDSEENKRNRSAETDQEKVEWVTEGRSILTLTQLDDGCIDVVCQHWGDCQGSLQAQYKFVGWMQGIVQWEQRLMSTGLLSAYCQ